MNQKIVLKEPFLTPEIEAIVVKSGLQCHQCGSDRVYELEEVSPANWNKITGIFYVCNACGVCWQFALIGNREILL